ncbi:MAG: UTP--glucose-1-phosphate uridylyltransferase GalU [Gammaproteobacteria bacterium]
MTVTVRTAVFPVAGRGTRFLPATKAVPKEMLPVVDKPLVQYAVEEAVAAGATKLVFVTHSSKGAIEDHFRHDADLEQVLEESGKHELLQLLKETVPPGVKCEYVLQGDPLGLGHAVLCAREAVGDEPFFVHLPDDLIQSDVGCLEQMAQRYSETGSSVVAVEEVPQEKTSSYGIVAVDDEHRMQEIVEKPAPEDAPSTLAVVGRYLLTPRIFELLETTPRGAGGEIQLTDAIAALLRLEPVYAYRFDGVRYDCGNNLGYITANIGMALARPELASGLKDYLSDPGPLGL